MNISLKRHFFFALMVIYAFTILWYRVLYWELPPREFLVSFPIVSLVFFPPFRFSRPRASFKKGWLRKKDGAHVHSEMRFEDISSITGSSIFGVLPTLTVTSKSGYQIDLSLKSDGVLDLEYSLLPFVENKDSLLHFFRYYRLIIHETNSLETAMISWLRLSILFGVVTPYLIWDKGMIADNLISLTLVWFGLTAGSAFVLLFLFAGFNRIIALISLPFAEKHLSTIRVWALLLLFFGYLSFGVRYSLRYFS